MGSLTNSLHQWFEAKSDHLDVYLAGEKLRRQNSNTPKKYITKFIILDIYYNEVENLPSHSQKLRFFKEAVYKIGRADDFSAACESWLAEEQHAKITPAVYEEWFQYYYGAQEDFPEEHPESSQEIPVFINL